MDQHDLETGVRIGDFAIESRVGAGGMGIVYKARQVSLDRVVALKVLGAAMTREADRARFQREAQAVAKLSHPAIASVHFIGQDKHICYMALEFIDGPSLRAIIDELAAACDDGLTIERALEQSHSMRDQAHEARFDVPTGTHVDGSATPANDKPAVVEPVALTSSARQLITTRAYLRRCCELVRDAALALAHAHERRVVHRDIKPENILIDRQGQPHLIDFGVARFFEDATLTNTGALVGTPMYMSPEQVIGRLDVDHRTDVYSLGLVLYELLTLTRPLTSPTREGLLRQIVTKAMPPVRARNPAIPRDLEGLLHKAIAKDPDDRHATAAEFADELQRWLDGKPVLALPYRYRLDWREIKAERPGGIMVIAFGHFLVAAFSVLISLAAVGGLLMLYFNPELTRGSGGTLPKVDRATLASTVPMYIGFLALASYSAPIGFGLLAANRWARWIAIVACATLSAWFIYDMAWDLWHRRWGPGTIVEVMVVGLAASIIVYLLRRATRDWFHLATRLRQEHARSSS